MPARGIARALAQELQILLVDEPTASLTEDLTLSCGSSGALPERGLAACQHSRCRTAHTFAAVVGPSEGRIAYDGRWTASPPRF
jgi:energy-coupling factor transporter ATP-binding protein EcfA2